MYFTAVYILQLATMAFQAGGLAGGEHKTDMLGPTPLGESLAIARVEQTSYQHNDTVSRIRILIDVVRYTQQPVPLIYTPILMYLAI